MARLFCPHTTQDVCSNLLICMLPHQPSQQRLHPYHLLGVLTLLSQHQPSTPSPTMDTVTELLADDHSMDLYRSQGISPVFTRLLSNGNLVSLRMVQFLAALGSSHYEHHIRDADAKVAQLVGFHKLDAWPSEATLSVPLHCVQRLSSASGEKVQRGTEAPSLLGETAVSLMQRLSLQCDSKLDSITSNSSAAGQSAYEAHVGKGGGGWIGVLFLQHCVNSELSRLV